MVAGLGLEWRRSINSGLFWMSDRLALQSNLAISLYLVAPDERRDKVEQELLRPTFSLREKPLARICGFLAFSVLCDKLAGIRKLGLSSSLKPTFLNPTPDFFPENTGTAIA